MMPAPASAYDIIRDSIDRLLASPFGRAELRRYNRVIEFVIEGQLPIYLKIQDGKPTLSRSGHPAVAISVQTDAEGLREIFQENKLIDLWMRTDRLRVVGTRRDRHGVAWLGRLIRLSCGERRFAPRLARQMGIDL